MRKCAKCKDIIDIFSNDDEYYYECTFCDNIICKKCHKKQYYMISATRSCDGICYMCIKKDIRINDLNIKLYDWRALRKKYDRVRKIKRNQTKYITELEAEIKLLKTMVDFQPDGVGYLAASENFKQMVKINDTIDDNDEIIVNNKLYGLFK
jgi:hypothetical protein